MLCAEWCLVKREHPGLKVIPLYCKCWSCEECRPRRAAQLAHDISAGDPNIFVTLTSRNPGYGSPGAAACALVEAWRVYRAQYLKANGLHSLPFEAVLEATKRGWPHLHIVARAKWIDARGLSRFMKAKTNSPIVKIKRVKNRRGIGRYLAKYLAKDPHCFEGCKRYWRSLDYPLTAEDSDPEDTRPGERWEPIEAHWLTQVAALERVGYFAQIGRNEATLTYAHPP